MLEICQPLSEFGEAGEVGECLQILLERPGGGAPDHLPGTDDLGGEHAAA